jgi:translation initiation factor 3 subunit C
VPKTAPAAAAAAAAKKPAPTTSRFLDSDSDSDDAKRVVKSAKDKRFDELRSTIQQLENAKKINDWSVIQKRMYRDTRHTDKRSRTGEISDPEGSA